MAKKRKREKDKNKRWAPSSMSHLTRGNLKEWKTDDDYQSDKLYWRSSRVRDISPRGYDAFLSREKAYLDNKKKQKQQQR